ncbi:protein mono-ADP-ribosyltransferase PARP14-like isoform X2 [Physella acuta]|uniref:protein mono-ADP-ribosyltransferase PARP14-like isoform X2 n=1 Tax=Physella acuta TaxID=109671 RepID=UPI0027DE5F2B|nr:protein mono-ADP-ribosyltransferase PARP14-like isoform X2 [Physella acuta]
MFSQNIKKMEKRLPNDEYRLNRAMNKIMKTSPQLDFSMLAEAAAAADSIGAARYVEMEVDNVNSVETNSAHTFANTVNYGASTSAEIMDRTVIQCEKCSNTFPQREFSICESNHKTCMGCFKITIDNFVDSKNINLMCPNAPCNSIVTLDKVTTSLDPIIYEQLKKKVSKRLAKVEAHIKESYLDKIFCLQCKIDITLSKSDIFYKCTACRHEACRICHRPVELPDNHVECKVLHHVGSKCFTDPKIFPANWEKSSATAVKNVESFDLLCSVELSTERQAVRNMFYRTFSDHSVDLKSIMRIQNPQLWEKYYLKRKHMVEEIGLDKIKERALFHGTKKENIDLICQEGFDLRVPTANAAHYGKGIYFSPWSKQSNLYTEGCEQMIIARVLCGYSTVGSSGMTRPPKDSSGRFYDTTVDNLDRPVRFCVFDNSQCYPAYIIDYSKKESSESSDSD